MLDGSLNHRPLIERFRVAFGEPDRAVGRYEHWALNSLKYPATIHILINAMGERAIVWLFDPNDAFEGVICETIAEEAQVEPLIKRIQTRLRIYGEGTGKWRGW